MASRRRLIAARMIVFRLINDSVDAPGQLLDSRFLQFARSAASQSIRALRLVPRRALVADWEVSRHTLVAARNAGKSGIVDVGAALAVDAFVRAMDVTRHECRGDLLRKTTRRCLIR